MGIYRFLLAALVVLFHFGGLSWIVGRIAVFAFYCISGFLIFQVLDRVYLDEWRGAGRFFANRVVRLAPLYAAYALATVALIAVGGTAFERALALAGVAIQGEPPSRLLTDTLLLEPVTGFDRWLPIVRFDPPLIPQGWSIGSEVVFYLAAPLVVLATRRHPAWMVGWLFAALAITIGAVRLVGVDFERFQIGVYKNTVTSAAVFFIGGACYYVRRRWGRFVPPPLAWVAIAVWLTLLVTPVFDDTFPLPAAAVFVEYLWLTLVVTCLVLLADQQRWRRLDATAGNLCYGVYLNHFLVAAVLLPLGAGGIVGGPGTFGFGALVLAGSTVLAAITYAVVERPFDRVRARVRGADVRETLPPAWRLRHGWTVAAVTALALLAGPVGWTIEQLNGAADDAALAMSGPFHIRWKPGVSAALRHRVETEFGLVAVGPVVRDPRHRTWEYRLPTPSRARVRALVTHPAVEDTARIDVERFEIAQ